METGACGNVCGECRLANLLKDTDLPGTLSDIAAESGLSLEVIREKFQCAGCRPAGNRCGNDCGIRKRCVISKQLDNCGLCDSFETCNLIRDFENDGLSIHRQAINNLRITQNPV